MDIFSHGFIGKVIYPAKIIKQDQSGTMMGFTLFVDGLGKDAENKFTAGKINCSYFAKDASQDRFALAIANVYNEKANPNAHLGEIYKSVQVAVNGQLSLKEIEGEGNGVYVNLNYVKGRVIDDKVNAMLKNIFAAAKGANNESHQQAPQQQYQQAPQQMSQQPVYAPGMQPPPQAPAQFVPQQSQQQQFVQQPQTVQYVQAPPTASQHQPQQIQTPVQPRFDPQQQQGVFHQVPPQETHQQPQYVQATQPVQQQQQQMIPQQQEQVIIYNQVPQVQPANSQDVNNIQNALGNSLPSAVMPTM